MVKNGHPQIGLALGSGSAKGLAHIGVLKVLEKHNIPIHMIAGSSIGAIFGAVYAAHMDVARLEEVIVNLNRRKGFELFDLTVKGGLLKGNKAETFLAETLDGATYETFKIPFAAVTTDLNTAEAVVFTKGDVLKAVRASASIPAFYQPVVYNDRLLSDGGLSNPVPVDVISAMGADITIAVNLDDFYIEKASQALPAITKIPMHSINVMKHNLAQQCVKNADVIISPQDVLNVGIFGMSFFFDKNKAAQIIQVGEAAAEKAIPQIQQAIKEYEFRQSRVGRLLTFFNRLKKRRAPLSFNS